MMFFWFIAFIVFSFLGWILDSSYCSLLNRRWTFSGYFHGVPLCPIYGFGGVVLLNSFAFFVGWPAWLVIVLTTLLVVIVEFIGGWLGVHLLDERLWDYSQERWNLAGYVSAWHSFLWLLVVGILYLTIGRWAASVVTWGETQLAINPFLEMLLLLALLAAIFAYTSREKQWRLAKIVKKEVRVLVSGEDWLDPAKWRKFEQRQRRLLIKKMAKINPETQADEVWERRKRREDRK